MQITAAVVKEVGGRFELEEASLSAPAANEVLVEIAGAGLCHTDLAVQAGHLPFPLPGGFGRGGSGVVTEVGRAVIKVDKGDKGDISFKSCGACKHCQ